MRRDSAEKVNEKEKWYERDMSTAGKKLALNKTKNSRNSMLRF